MRKKDELAIDKIAECAKREFLEKGFDGASMRDIAESAGYTTGMLYGRFADKDELFRAIVGDVADGFFSFFEKAQSDFASLPPEDQYKNMHGYAEKKTEEMLGIVYDNFDVFKLIVCKSRGSGYEKFIDRLAETETDNTMRFIRELSAAGLKVNEVRADLTHMLATAMINGMFEVVEHDFAREDAIQYVKELQSFFDAGWDRLLGMSERD